MSFLNELHLRYSVEFDKASSHRLTKELCEGTLSDKVLHTYLTQDLKFFMTSLRFIARTLSLCDDDDATIYLGKQIGFFSNDEHTYFRDTLKELENSGSELFPSMREESPKELVQVSKYLKTLSELTSTDTTYAANIATLYIAEVVYLRWAEDQGGAEEHVKKLPPKFKGWIDLHRGPDFSAWVDFLGSEVERVAKENPSAQKAIFTAVKKTLDFEYEFFEECFFYRE